MSDLVTLSDICLRASTLQSMSLVDRLRNEHLAAKTQVCIERARYVTEYLRDQSDPAEPVVIRRARAVAHYLKNRDPIFHDDNPIAGATTSMRLGAPVYPELLHLAIWPELDTISDRDPNPQELSDADRDLLNFEIFPYWMDGNVLEVTRKQFDTPPCLRLLERIRFYISGKVGCISHCIPTYKDALERGLEAIVADAATREAALGEGPLQGDEAEKRDFYQAVQISLEGILAYAQALSQKAAELELSTANSDRKENYRRMKEVCAKVPAQPATTYREAVNSLWLCQVGIHAENINMAISPGRLDQLLYPFYKEDVAQNRRTPEEALELTCCLWLKLADNTILVPEAAEELWGGAGAAPAVTLGGVDGNGDDVVNDLTYIMLRATELMVLRDPNLNARFHYVKNDPTYLERVCDVIVNTRAIPALHNDVADIQTLKNQNQAPAHACDYGIVGCVELASAGRDYVASSSIMLNLAAAMEMALRNGRRPVGDTEEQFGPQTGEPDTFTSFEQFWDAFEAQLRWLIGQAVEMNEKLGAVHQQILPTPLLSSFFEGCLGQGRDLIQGGAIYNSSGASHVAFPDVCDSLNAIEFAVFQEQRLTMAKLADAVKNNFEPPNHQHFCYLKNRTPKFGTNDPIARKNAQALITLLYQEYQSYTNYRGGPYRPAYWTMTTHAGQGARAGALPNGRKKGEPFSSGITPVSQATQSLPGVYNAVASLPGNCIPGGEALNIKYTPHSGDQQQKSDYVRKMAEFVKGYFQSGGLQVQYNIRSYQDLMAARDNPAACPHLIVRVSGYSAYFNDLSDAMKEELITRTQYDLEQGTAVPLP